METIQLKDETKTKLTQIAHDIEKETGQPVNIDEVISFLIEEHLEKKKNWDQFELFLKPLKNISKEQLLNELKKGRKEDEKIISSN